MTDPARVAVLIDCDNISYKVAKEVLGETAKHGTLSVKRGYGDWASTHLAGWRPELTKHAIQPVQQFAYRAGKNATDTALIIDAMDLLYSNTVDVFCLVTSDSDFTRLAMRLRESGRRVYGIGARNTPEALTNAYDRFTFIEVLTGGSLVPGNPVPAGVTTAKAGTSPLPTADGDLTAKDDVDGAEPALPNLHDVVVPAIHASANDDGWALLATVGGYMVNSTPSFDSRNYGFPKLGALVRSLTYVKVKEVPDASGFTQLWVRLRTGA